MKAEDEGVDSDVSMWVSLIAALRARNVFSLGGVFVISLSTSYLLTFY